MRFPSLAPTPIRLPLACDPLMVASNQPDALYRYIETGDPSGLTVPEGTTHIVVRPLTPLRRADVERAAGSGSALGAALASMLLDADPDTRSKASAEAEKPGGAEALATHRAWLRRLTLAGVDACVTVEGAPAGMTATDALGAIQADTDVEAWRLRREAVEEAALRVWSASLLGALPKVP